MEIEALDVLNEIAAINPLIVELATERVMRKQLEEKILELEAGDDGAQS